jgi:GNAT superfamily N-acetyltransferase
MGIYIRNAREEDAIILGSIYSQSYRAAFKGIIPDNILEGVFSPEKRAEGLHKEILEGAPTNAVLFDEDKPVGLLTYGKPKDEEAEDDAVEIWRIYLLPSYWGQNLGAPLMNWGIDEIKGKGYKKITLWVLEENSRARRFYEKLGFVFSGTTRIINPGKELVDLKYIKNLKLLSSTTQNLGD